MERAPASAREPIRVLLADDQPLLVQALAKILGSQPDIDVVATAADGHEAAMAADRFTLDVAVLGIQMPRMNGIEAAREITRRQPGVSVVMLTTFDTDDLVRAALQEGVQGFLLKDSMPEFLIDSVHRVARGASVLSPGATDFVLSVFREPTETETVGRAAGGGVDGA